MFGYYEDNVAQCKPCNQIMPGCNECVLTTTPQMHTIKGRGMVVNDNFLKIKDEKVLDDFNVLPAEYLYCKTPGEGLYPYKYNGQTIYKECQDIFAGCKPRECT